MEGYGSGGGGGVFVGVNGQRSRSGRWLPSGPSPRTPEPNPSLPHLPLDSLLGGIYGGRARESSPAVFAAGYNPGESLPRFSLIDDASRQLEMLRLGNGGFDRDCGSNGNSGIDYGLNRSMPGSPRFHSSLYANYQRDVAGAGMMQNSLREIDYVVSSNADFLRANGDNRTALSPPMLFCLSLRSLQGRIASLSCDQDCCKYLQWKIKQGLDEEEIEILFNEIADKFKILMVHKYANYVVQLLIEVCNEQQRNAIIKRLTMGEYPMFFYICGDQYGTRVIQKLLANASTHQRRFLLSTIAPRVADLVTHANGRHVVLYCLETFSDQDNELLYIELAGNCYDISIDKNGCCVMQKCFDYSQGEQRKLLLRAIIAVALHLSTNIYGNYVVQHILKLQVPGFIAALIRQLGGNFSMLSCDKYASNVVECCIRRSGIEHFTGILGELLRDPGCMSVFLNRYGNYVFTSAVEVAKLKGFESIFLMLQAVIQTNAKLINTDFHGKKAVSRLRRDNLLLPETDAALRRLF